MHLYLPIAELSANIYLLLALGGLAGLLSGLFGIGGGFVLTPMLIFIGVPPDVAVATATSMIVASSFSGFLTHWRARRVDMRMGSMLVLGGLIGAHAGVMIFTGLKRAGQIDSAISILYMLLLGSVGLLMAKEARQMMRGVQVSGPRLQLPQWVEKLPLSMRFADSGVSHSALLPVALGALSGLLVGLLGVGGGFVMIPLMLYVLRMPLQVTVGTSLFQIIFLTAASTLLHAVNTHTVDILLGLLLLVGSTIGTQFGVRLSTRIPPQVLKAVLAALLIVMACQLAFRLVIAPGDNYQLVIKP